MSVRVRAIAAWGGAGLLFLVDVAVAAAAVAVFGFVLSISLGSRLLEAIALPPGLAFLGALFLWLRYARRHLRDWTEPRGALLFAGQGFATSSVGLGLALLTAFAVVLVSVASFSL
jgi:hypothetical protein